jgi:hypothetical protein
MAIHFGGRLLFFWDPFSLHNFNGLWWLVVLNHFQLAHSLVLTIYKLKFKPLNLYVTMKIGIFVQYNLIFGWFDFCVEWQVLIFHCSTFKLFILGLSLNIKVLFYYNLLQTFKFHPTSNFHFVTIYIKPSSLPFQSSKSRLYSPNLSQVSNLWPYFFCMFLNFH